MCKTEDYTLSHSEDQTITEAESQPIRDLKEMQQEKFIEDKPDEELHEESASVDKSESQQSQPVDTINADLSEQHFKLEADSETPSTSAEDQIMDKKELWKELLDRERNFHDGAEWKPAEDDPFLSKFEELYKRVEADISEQIKAASSQSPSSDEMRLIYSKILSLIYSETYDYVVSK